MATTTPNYGWDVPTSSDYVKQGAVAIETLGDDIDSTLYTALGGNYPGLRLIKKQTVGSGVSVIPVPNAFSATYDNYKIMYSNGVGSTALSLQMTLTGSTANYASSVIYAAYSGGGVAAASLGTTSWSQAGDASTGGCSLNVELSDPFNTKLTGFRALTSVMNTAGSTIAQNGLHNVSSSYTGFTLTTSTGTVSGGTVYVYGYGTS